MKVKRIELTSKRKIKELEKEFQLAQKVLMDNEQGNNDVDAMLRAMNDAGVASLDLGTRLRKRKNNVLYK